MRGHRWFPWIVTSWLVAVAPAWARPTARFEPAPEATDPRPTPERIDDSPRRHRPSAAPDESWATSAARELVRRARALERRGQSAEALVRYSEAIRMDASYGPAYLGLARLRSRLGDPREAERVYTRATRLGGPTRAQSFAERARLRARSDRHQAALQDLERAVALDPFNKDHSLTLARWYEQRRAWPAALAVWRRIDALGLVAREQASLRIRALSYLAAATDPVTTARGGDWVRRSLAILAQRD